MEGGAVRVKKQSTIIMSFCVTLTFNRFDWEKVGNFELFLLLFCFSESYILRVSGAVLFLHFIGFSCVIMGI